MDQRDNQLIGFDDLEAIGYPTDSVAKDGWVYVTVEDPNHLQGRKTIDLSPDEYREVHEPKFVDGGPRHPIHTIEEAKALLESRRAQNGHS